MRRSIIQIKQMCRYPGCCRTQNLHSHEVFYGTANRKKSIEDGMVIYLCGDHHNLSDKGIHFNKKFDLQEKKKAQYIWELEYGKEDPRAEFIKRYGRSYL